MRLNILKLLTITRRTAVNGIIILLLLNSSAFAQVQWGYEELTRGKLWQTIWNSLQYGEPNNLFSRTLYTMDYPGYSKGTDAGDALTKRYSPGIYNKYTFPAFRKLCISPGRSLAYKKL